MHLFDLYTKATAWAIITSVDNCLCLVLNEINDDLSRCLQGCLVVTEDSIPASSGETK
jgi:hypothetical protein